MLKGGGYRVRPVSSGEMALRAVQTMPPDLILLDISMPEMNGYEVCRRLKEDERSRDIPVLFISALNETEDKVRAFQAGGVDYVSKPFQFEEVDARVRTHLKLRSQQRELGENYTRLLELEKLRDSLTHMIVHDMRSPLLAVRMSVELLRDAVPENDRPSRELLDTASKGTLQLVEMVSQMLDISRMEAGKMELDRKRTDLAALADAVIEELRPLAGTRALGFAVSGLEWVECDPDLVRRVIGNLLGNALKFTPADGRIDVEVGESAGGVRVSVRDTGRGIPTEYHARIFDKFGQVDDVSKRVGTGLGLTFCKMVVEAHGGQIGVDSAPGQGSNFWFVLPR